MFERYLPLEGGSQPDNRTECDEMGTSDISQPHSPEPGCADVKSQKSNNDGVLGGCAVAEGDSGKQSASSPFNGGEPGLSRRRVDELAAWYQDRAYGQYQQHGDVSSADLDAGLRMVLAEEVLPEFIETEFQRIMAVVFR